MKKYIFFAIISILAGLFIPATTFAADKNTGLYISPIRKNTTVESGKAKADFFTIANHTKKPMTVQLSVKQFSAIDYSDDLQFSPPQNNWIKLQSTDIILLPDKSQKIYYDIEVPAKSTPGGQYYTFIASTQIEGDGLPSTVQATSLLYLTVNGDLIRTSILKNSSAPWFVTGNSIPYKFDIEDLGNVHFSVYSYGQLESIFGPLPQVGASHLLMPHAVRTVSGYVPSPFLPGVYQITYGYKVDFADFIVTKSSLVVYAPPWSFVALLFIILAVIWFEQQLKKYRKQKD
jgi:hypothetical protein